MKKELYLRNISEHLFEYNWWRHVVTPFLLRKGILEPYFRYFSTHDGTNVMAEDWDNLVILDACRFDMFKEINYLTGELECRRSLGSSTPDFLRNNFSGRTFLDTVYITANPQINVHLDSIFHSIINVWEEGWDEDMNTVHPQTMTKNIKQICDKYPNKRIIAHYIQPHYPFIGETGKQLIGAHAGVELSRRIATGEDAIRDNENIWIQLRKAKIDRETVWEAYLENLEITLPHVEELVQYLSGKTIITSDHGNLIGEKVPPFPIRIYGHHEGIYTPNLVNVPWLVINSDTRRKITSEPSVSEGQKIDLNAAKDRLQDLGYK